MTAEAAREKIMHRCSVNTFPRNTAAYVVSHAKWRRSRGRNPSEPYRGERNPRKALAQANRDLEELAIYEPAAAEGILQTARAMVENARITGRSCTTVFNWTPITAHPIDTPEQVVSRYHQESDRRVALEQASPLAQMAKRKAEEELLDLKKGLDQLMAQLPRLDFSNRLALVNWLEQFQVPSERHGIDRPWQTVVATFAQHGFMPKTNNGVKAEARSEAEAADLLIGWALEWLTNDDLHRIHWSYPKMASEVRPRARPLRQTHARDGLRAFFPTRQVRGDVVTPNDNSPHYLGERLDNTSDARPFPSAQRRSGLMEKKRQPALPSTRTGGFVDPYNATIYLPTTMAYER